MNTSRSRMLLLALLPAALLATSSPCLAGGEVNFLVGNKWFAAE